MNNSMSQNQQVLVNHKKDKFMIVKKVEEFASIVTPFAKDTDDNCYDSNFHVMDNRSSRAIMFYNMIPTITHCYLHDHTMWIDSVSEANAEIFKDMKNGFAHLEYYFEKKKFRTRLMIKSQVYEPFKPLQVEVAKFRSFKLKIFPIIMESGFMVSISDKNEAILYMTIEYPEHNMIGSGTPNQIPEIDKNINALWPNLIVPKQNDQSIEFYLNSAFSNDFITCFKQPLMLKFKKTFTKPDIMESQVIGIGF